MIATADQMRRDLPAYRVRRPRARRRPRRLSRTLIFSNRSDDRALEVRVRGRDRSPTIVDGCDASELDSGGHEESPNYLALSVAAAAHHRRLESLHPAKLALLFQILAGRRARHEFRTVPCVIRAARYHPRRMVIRSSFERPSYRPWRRHWPFTRRPRGCRGYTVPATTLRVHTVTSLHASIPRSHGALRFAARAALVVLRSGRQRRHGRARSAPNPGTSSPFPF